MVDAIILAFVSVSYLALMSLVISNNRYLRINQVLALLLLLTPIWTLVVFLEDVVKSEVTVAYLVRADYALAAILIGILYWFCVLLTGMSVKYANRAILLLVVANVVLALTGAMTTVTKEAGELVLHPNPMPFGMMTILVAGASVYSAWLVVRSYHVSEGKQRVQIAWVGVGLLSTVLLLTVSLIALPRFFDNSSPVVTRLGLYSTLVFAIFSTYAILRHKFLDIRQAAARTTAYVLVFSALTVVYVGLVFAGVRLFLGADTVPVSQFVLFTVSAILLAFVQQPLAHVFNQLTDKIFFRRAYKTQEILAEMGDITAKNNNLQRLTVAVARLLERAFHPGFIVLYLPKRKDEYDEYYYATGKAPLQDEVRHYVANNIHKNFATLRHNYSNEEQAISIVIPLEVSRKVFGYILLGQKQQGSWYDKKDHDVIMTIGDELSLAIENSLRFQQIVDLNKTLQQRVVEATTELRTTNSKLREIDASKDEFISMASHQLRTPLTSVKGYISMLLDGDLGDIRPEQRKALEEAYDSSQRMVYLIGDFLNLSRIQTGRFELEKTPVSLSRLIGEEIDQLRQSAKSRNVSLLYSAPAEFPDVLLDETKIRQVMMNFIDNAVYYAKSDGGEVLIVLEKQRDAVLFTVKDNGIGVPARARRHLFTKFYRADNAKKARPDGTGIGLYMAKRVVVAHGGSIIFESKEGEGSEFGFRLPIVR